jgi:hypothetical protein
VACDRRVFDQREQLLKLVDHYEQLTVFGKRLIPTAA